MNARSAMVLAGAAIPALLLPCLPVVRYGLSIGIASESAVIVWDAKSQTEHFIRRAEFRTNAKDVGFLVPTPSVPKLAAADPHLIWRLSKIVDSHRPVPAEPTKGVAAAAPVQVLSTQKVAGYQATILKSKDASAVARWLKKNQYPVTAATKEWLEPYVKMGWTLTAFKVARGRSFATLEPVRMSFQTKKPVYPYREPAAPNVRGRSLRLFVLSDRSVQAKHGSRDWAVRPEHQGLLTKAEERDIRKLLKVRSPLPSRFYLTSYLDMTYPRDGSRDLWFVD